MSILPAGISRVSNLLQASVLSSSIDQTQQQLLLVQNELTTGKSVNQPSDNPAAASTIIQLQQGQTRRQTYSANVNSASAQLGQVDSTLGNLTNLLQQAEQIASADVNSNVTASQRQSDASIVQSLYNQALSMGNQSFEGQFLFGGAAGSTQPFVEANGHVQFVGSSQTLQNTYDDGISLSFQVNGASVFGSLASGATGGADIAPSLTAQTRISDLGGTSGNGAQLTSLQLSNGTVSKTVDLSSADTIGDVINSINNAAVGGITASISGQGLTLTGASGDNITVTDSGGTTAQDLGINTPSGGAGVGNPVVGSSVNPKVTDLTPASALRNGSGLDNSGLVISNGSVTKTITWPSGGTVQDVLNAINGAGLGVKAQINSTSTGIEILNATQGTSLSVGENGGTTATELGLRTLDLTTPLSQLNNGAGVSVAGGSTADFQISTAGGGTPFQVSLGGAQTVQDVLNAINTAGGGSVTAALATTGNGIVLTDTTTGSGTFAVTALNNSRAAANLGIDVPASGNTITTSDVGAPTSTGIFGNLAKLAASLQTGDQVGMTAAAQGIQGDINRTIQIRGQTGAVEQQLQSRQTQLTTENTAAQSLLSQLQDTDMASTISQFETLQTALQASLRTAANSMNLSLLDFVR